MGEVTNFNDGHANSMPSKFFPRLAGQVGIDLGSLFVPIMRNHGEQDQTSSIQCKIGLGELIRGMPHKGEA
jgi:hypothetical protein